MEENRTRSIIQQILHPDPVEIERKNSLSQMETRLRAESPGMSEEEIQKMLEGYDNLLRSRQQCCG